MLTVQEDEVQRIKNSIESQYVMDRVTLLSKAMNLAMCDALGDIELANTSLANYLSLTREDLIAATKKYLRPDNCSTLYYLPSNGKSNA